MRFGQQGVFRKNDDHVVVDQCAGKDHARLEVFYGNSTHDESLLEDSFLLY